MKVTQSQLEQYLSKAAWILKGPVDASDFKSYIFPLLFFKRISDVYDEEYELALKESGNDKEYASLKEFHRFIIPKIVIGRILEKLQQMLDPKFKQQSVKLSQLIKSI